MQAGFDPRRVAVVSGDEPLQLPAGPLEGTAGVTSHEPDRVVVRASPSRDALLVLADNYYQGWVARVDGQAVPIHRVNHTMRGVVVPAGEHEVVFTYEPSDLYIGLYIYLAGMALLLGYAVFLGVRHVRGRRPVPAPA